MTIHNEYAGLAALAICESLMLAMNDSNILPEAEIMGVLRDAEDTHLNAIGKGSNDVMHKGVADLINKIIVGGNSVRRT